LRRLRVFCITQVIDPEHTYLGFMHGWLTALAARVERFEAVALEVNPKAPVPENAGFHALPGGPLRALRRGLALESLLLSRLWQRRVDVIFQHMCPIYANLTAPLGHWFGVPSVLWYAHPAVTPELHTALRRVDAVATSTPEGMPLDDPKAHVLCQGIDTERFSPLDQAECSVGSLPARICT